MAEVEVYGSPPGLAPLHRKHTSFPHPTMLWNIGHPFQSILEAPNDIAAARRVMIEKIKADPGAFITKITPAEPSVKNLLDLGKAVFGIRT